MLKAAIDSNVIISALIKKDGSDSRKIIEKVLENKVIPLMREALFSELMDVSSRQDIFGSCILTENERQEFLQDEADNHIIELAIAGGAINIVTKNIKDLKNGELQFEKLQIVTPDEFIKKKLWEQSQ